MKKSIQISQLVKKYKDRIVLDIENLHLDKNKIYVVLGENGAGKSTLLKLITGNVAPTRGDIFCDYSFFGYLPQKPYIFDMTVRRNLELVTKDELVIKEILRNLQLEHLEYAKAKTLSGGEMQRLALARILLKEHKLLILDEPTSAMDIHGARIVEDVLMQYQAKNQCCILMTTHDLGQARRLQDEVLFMKQGKIIEKGEFHQVFYESKNESVRAFIKYYQL